MSIIITNLITNSIQAKKENEELEIKVTVENIYKKVKIIVEDNGIGIPKDKIAQIFEPNFTTKTSGTGLGLSMVKKMIEDYDGEITLTSEENVFTKFTINLPLK